VNTYLLKDDDYFLYGNINGSIEAIIFESLN